MFRWRGASVSAPFIWATRSPRSWSTGKAASARPASSALDATGWDEPKPFADIAAYQAADPDPYDLEELPAVHDMLAAREPGFLAGVLQFVANHEPTLLSFAESAGIKPQTVMDAMRALPLGNEDYDRSI